MSNTKCFGCRVPVSQTFHKVMWCDACAVAKKCFGCRRPGDPESKKRFMKCMRALQIPGWNPQHVVYYCRDCYLLHTTCPMCNKTVATVPALVCSRCYSASM